MKTRAVIAVMALAGATLWATAGVRSTPAQATEGVAGTFECSTTLTEFPGNGAGVCTGTLDGVALPATHPDTPSPMPSPTKPAFQANYNYGEPSTTRCLQGNANGTVTVGGTELWALFSWTRVGATAVVTLNGRHTGVAVAVFEADRNAVVACLHGGKTANLAVHVQGVVVALDTP